MPRVRAIWARGVPAWSRAWAAAMVSAVSPGRPGWRPFARAAATPAAVLGGDGSLELGDGPENLKNQATAGGSGVDDLDDLDDLGERAELDAAVLEVAGHSEQVRERSAEAVQPPHHEHVPASGIVQERGQLGAIVTSTGYALRPNSLGPSLRQRLYLHVRGTGAASGLAHIPAASPAGPPSSVGHGGFRPNRDACGRAAAICVLKCVPVPHSLRHNSGTPD